MGKNIFLSLYVFDTNLLNFYSFLKVFWCCHLSYLLFLLSLFYILFILKRIIACLLKGKNWRKKCMKIKNKQKKCWGYPKHLFELLVIAIACVQKYIFYEKKAKTKKIILTPCAIKLSFIRHGFCHSQQVCLYLNVFERFLLS